MKDKSGSRPLKVRVKTARKRSTSSTRWLQRQLNDPYVKRAKKEGYRSRAAYKLLELDEKFHFLGKGKKIIDLGAAPGGWSQVAAQKAGKGGRVIAVDLLPVPPVEGVEILQLDFLAKDAPARIKETLSGKADIVLSDMAPNASGQTSVDHLRIMALVEEAFHFAKDVLADGGTFIAKVWQGGTEAELLALIKSHFKTVKHAKPKASRSDSAETYVVALGFRNH